MRAPTPIGSPTTITEIEIRYVFGGRGIERRYIEEAVNDSVQKYCSVAATVSARARITHSYETTDEKS